MNVSFCLSQSPTQSCLPLVHGDVTVFASTTVMSASGKLGAFGAAAAA